MKKANIVKRAISAICVTALFVTIAVPASAYHGYAHWDIARRAAETYGVSTSYRSTYMNGTLAADIGRMSWDNYYTTSDTTKFANTMRSLASTTQEIYYANGWYDHVTEDNYVNMYDIFPNSGLSYTALCGKVDNFLRDTRNISCPLNGTATLTINYNMIRNTYKQLDNFSPTDSQIKDAYSMMVGAYNSAIILGGGIMTSTQISAMDSQLGRAALNCMPNRDTPYDNGMRNSPILPNSSDADVLDLFAEQLQNEEIMASYQQLQEQINEIAYLEEIGESNGFTELRFVIEDEQLYEQLLTEGLEIIMGTN